MESIENKIAIVEAAMSGDVTAHPLYGKGRFDFSSKEQDRFILILE